MTDNGALVTLLQHKAWATLKLIEHCRDLSGEQLAATVPGTFGSIHATLQHLVGADEGYFGVLTGERPQQRLTRDELVPLAELEDRFRRLAPRWEELARDPDVHSRELSTRDGWRVLGSVVLAQSVHHADDHRSHILTIIGTLGIDLPGLDIDDDLDVWHHAIATGTMQKLES